MTEEFPKVLLQKGQKLDWITPYSLWKELNNEFHFELDAATCKHNLMGTPYYYTEEQDGLKGVWKNPTYVNPPYGRDSISKWLEKAYHESMRGITSVFLLPSRTGTKWFHIWIWNSIQHRPRWGTEIRFLPSRLLFGVCKHCYPNTETIPNTAPFDSMVVIFRAIPTTLKYRVGGDY